MNRTIMIVEDEADIRAFVRIILEKENYQVSEAADARSLRAALEGTPPAAVILDLNLPDGNALDILPELKRRWPGTKVIILTGFGTPEVAEEAYKLDKELFLHCKPVDAGTLIALVELALSGQPGAAHV